MEHLAILAATLTFMLSALLGFTRAALKDQTIQ